MSGYVWTPTREQVEQANVTRLQRKLGCADYHELHRLSVEEPERFWRAIEEEVRESIGREAADIATSHAT